MTKKKRAVLAIIGLLFAVILTPSPAHAAGWSGKRCTSPSGIAGDICAEWYTVDLGSNYQLTKVRLCARKYYGAFQWLNGTYNSGWYLYGSNGVLKAAGGVNDVVANTNSPYGNCEVKDIQQYVTSGASACIHVLGRLDLEAAGDQNYTITGNVLGGAC